MDGDRRANAVKNPDDISDFSPPEEIVLKFDRPIMMNYAPHNAENDWRDVGRPSSCYARHLPPCLVIVYCLSNAIHGIGQI